MKLVEGYKDTELGPIPQDWAVATVAEIAQITTGSRNTQDKVEDGQFPFFVRSQTVERINSFSYDGEAVLTAGDGVGTGKIFHYINGPFDCHQRVYRMSGFADRMDGFFFYKCFSISFYDRIMSMTAKSSVDSVRREMIADMTVPVPPLSEQKAIADALRDMDQLISSLDALIAKKRGIKIAVIQSLLGDESSTLKGGWQTLPLRQVCRTIVDGTHFTPQYQARGIPFYSVENITNDNFSETKFVSKSAHSEMIKRCHPERGDILMTRIGSIGETKLIDWDVNASIYVSLALLKLGQNVTSQYLYAYSKSESFKRDIETRALTNAAPKKINMNEIGQVPISFPVSLEEQQRFAKIVFELEDKIVALSNKARKFEQIRIGLGQQLLTGRIRLV